MELCSKILKRTDVEVRLSFPTATMRKHFRLDQEGGKSVDFKVTDKYAKVWPFRLYTRNNGHPKPVLTKGWINFVKKNKLRVGDKVIFFVHENGDQLGIRVQRNIKLLGQEHWAEYM
ncbi:B3 DNA binding domain - like 10 [Theobroma cacao]|uniref:TF-B3 domain-containing protein n=1 Tax=Theobroma cacao TaxID=3641 RepID=A0A061DZI0_THECC|nr:Uncharacterized protein TCM_006954 [Theobroma cacao]WRX14359.1 B3 DNA binding domain - like 10 [Theobroma cacao]